MILTTTTSIPGRKIAEILGIVSGETVRSRAVGEPLLKGLKQTLAHALALGPTIITGEESGLPKEEETETPHHGHDIEAYAELIREMRSEALKRLEAAAEVAGADAVIGVRYLESVILLHALNVVAYGTAVRLG